MNRAVDEWIVKADGDFATANRELRARISPNYDSACFHSQQCAEKYLKAVLQKNRKHIPKIHYLLELLALIMKFDSSFEFLRADLEALEEYSVRFRYPGEFAEKEEARAAYRAATVVRNFARQKLGLE
ncbi:MAG: HEPN domain-containing protein [Anaerolineales bacterium]|nr:MAG: HEPN domain-containing protein [Anaerolineales bacterium]